MIRVLCVDDHPALRAGLLTVIRREPGLVASAAVGSARTVVEETLRAADRLVEETDGVRIVDTVTVFR